MLSGLSFSGCGADARSTFVLQYSAGNMLVIEAKWLQCTDQGSAVSAVLVYQCTAQASAMASNQLLAHCHKHTGA